MLLAILTLVSIIVWVIAAKFNYYLIECTLAMHRFANTVHTPRTSQQNQILIDWNINNQKWHHWQVAAFFTPIIALTIWATESFWLWLPYCFHIAAIRFAVYDYALNHMRGIPLKYIESRSKSFNSIFHKIFDNPEKYMLFLRLLSVLVSSVLILLID